MIHQRRSDELIADGEKFDKATNGHALVWNYTEPYFFIPFLTGYGGWVMDSLDNPTLDTPAMVQALKFMKDLRDKYRIIPKSCDYETADALFKEGKAEMIINGPWSFGSYERAGLDFGVKNCGLLRRQDHGPHQWFRRWLTQSTLRSRHGKSPEVVKLIKFLLSTEIQREFTIRFDTVPLRGRNFIMILQFEITIIFKESNVDGTRWRKETPPVPPSVPIRYASGHGPTPR